MRGLFLILKNSFRNALKNWFQLTGLTVLVSLLALVLSLLASINVRVIESYNFLKDHSNSRNVVLQLDPFDRVETGEVEGSSAPKNLVEAQQYWLYELQDHYYREQNDLQFEWSRTEAREFSQVKNAEVALTLKVIAKVSPDNVFNQNGVDKLVIFEGHNIQSDRQVVIDATFAKRNSIEIGEIIRIQKDNFGEQLLVGSDQNKNISPKLLKDIDAMKKQGLEERNGIYQTEYRGYDWYQVVGYGGSADFMMPVINKSSVLPNRKTESLVYVDPLAFGLELTTGSNMRKGLYEYNPNSDNGRRLTVSSNNEWESFYSLRFLDNHEPSSGDVKQMNADFNQYLSSTTFKVGDKTYFYSTHDANYRYASRTMVIDQTISGYNIGSSILEILLIIIVLYSIGLVTRKQIEKIQGQIGTLKALGYHKQELILNFVTTPIFAAFIGGIVGFAIAGGLSGLIINTFADYFLLNYGVAQFDWLGFILTIIALWIVLSGLTFVIAYFFFKKNTLTLINARQTSKASRFGTSYRDKKNAKIGSKISSALLADATGKMSVVGIVVLIATMVFTISFAAPDILRRNQVASYTGIKYKQVVDYSDPVYNNPLTFYKTFNAETSEKNPHTYQHSANLEGFTSLPLDENGNYDVNQIMFDYAQNQIDNEFYSLLVTNGSTSPDAVPIWSLTNMRFLSGRDIASSTDYYRFMAGYGQKGDGFIDQILLNQWPDYNELMALLGDENKNLTEVFSSLQGFYARYVDAIGLSISNPYYDDQIPPSAGDDEKINSFNTLCDPDKILADTKRQETNHFSSQLKALTVSDNFSFKLTDSQYKLGVFHITDDRGHNNQEAVSDYFLTLKADELTPEQLNDNLIALLIWYGSLFSTRGDQGIIQAAYFRPPYFVQQYFKDAYLNNKTYVQSFGVVSYNDELEQIGTRLNVQSSNGNEFKIYGIQPSTTKFLDLKNKNSTDLIADLYQSEDKNGIIINKSVAKILNLKTGDQVNLAVLQDELREKTADATNPITLDNWNLPQQRDSADLKNGFTQLNNLDNSLSSQSSLNTPSGKSWNLKPNLLKANEPSELYQNVLWGNLANEQLRTDVDFKVVGIHDGYGTPQAWIKEDDAQKILKFDEVKKFAWDKWFTAQWGNEFIHDHQDPRTQTIFKGIADLDFSQRNISYDEFVQTYLHSSDPEIATAAKIVFDIFNNAFPIFNYKYSNKDDVGDLSKMVATHQKFGDYSPIAMQGISANGRDIKTSYDGVGLGAIGTIVPIEISKEILNKISDLVMLVLILAIIAILLVTFVIIFLTTSLIIDDNVKFIATMKTLGYSNAYIASKVLGMYFIVIGSVFVIGFIAGWFIFATIVQALVPTIVLPLKFQAWLPFVVLLGVAGIYLITISVGFSSIAKTNAVEILQNNDL